MKTFIDSKKREWELEINWGTVKRIRRDLKGLDITNIGENGFIKDIQDDGEKLIDMLYVILKSQIDELKIDPVDFAEGFVGDVIDTSVKVFFEELIEFFPEKKREATRKLVEKTGEVLTLGYQRVGREIDEISAVDLVDQAFEEVKQI